MERTYESIKEWIIYLFDKYKLKVYYKDNRESFINRMSDYIYLILNTDIKFIDILKEVRYKYNYNTSLLQPERDLMQYGFKLFSLYYNIPLEDIKVRYNDNYDDIEERMLFRIELYKEGWVPEKIERYIYKYIIKQSSLSLSYYDELYYNIMTHLKVYRQEKECKIGRPGLPVSLKEYIKNKHVSKLRDSMRKKYKYSNEYEKIKDNLLTKEEVEYIVNNIDNVNIIDKIRRLQIYEISDNK